MKKLLLLTVLAACFANSAPLESEKGLLVVDFESAGAARITGTDVTKLQDPDFPEQVKALKYKDQIIFKTAEGIFTGTVGVAYRDVNMVEVRAGYFDPRGSGNREIFHFTYDQDALVGWMEYTYLAKEYNILYTKASGKLTAYSEESRMKDFRYFPGGEAFQIRYDKTDLLSLNAIGGWYMLNEHYFHDPLLYQD